MSLDLSLEIWEALRPHIAGGFQAAADDFVSILSENAYSLEELSENTTDSYIRSSLKDYIELDDDEPEIDDDMDEYS
jgi:hypothetical protein